MSSPIFIGAARTVTHGGIPQGAAVGVLFLTGELMILVHPACVLVGVILWPLLAAITRHDDKILRIAWLALTTSWHNRHCRFWGGSSYSPVVRKRQWKR